MILISHRGNLDGRLKNVENSPDYITFALNQGYDVEIDIWYVDFKFYLGHDEPLYKIEEKFLENKNLWCHAKNEEALFKMLQNQKIHCFWHQSDDYTLTSKGIPWVYPGKKVSEKGIWVLPELTPFLISSSMSFGLYFLSPLSVGSLPFFSASII
jgi:hypothetical protein